MIAEIVKKAQFPLFVQSIHQFTQCPWAEEQQPPDCSQAAFCRPECPLQKAFLKVSELPSQQQSDAGNILCPQAADGTASPGPRKRSKYQHQRSNAPLVRELQNGETPGSTRKEINEPCDWRPRQRFVGLSTVGDYKATIQELISGTSTLQGHASHCYTSSSLAVVPAAPNSSQALVAATLNSGQPLVKAAINLAFATRASLTVAAAKTSIANFQSLLLLSYCAYFRKRDMGETANAILCKTFDISSKFSTILLNRAIAINQFIQELVSLGWSLSRATELLLIGSSYVLIMGIELMNL